jgi:hypothetical protein
VNPQLVAVSPDAETDAAAESSPSSSPGETSRHLEEWFRTRRSFPPNGRQLRGVDSLLYVSLEEQEAFKPQGPDWPYEYLDRVARSVEATERVRPVAFLAYTFPLPPTPAEEGR